MIIQPFFGGWIDLSKIVRVSDMDYQEKAYFPEPTFSIEMMMAEKIKVYLHHHHEPSESLSKVHQIHQAHRERIRSLGNPKSDEDIEKCFDVFKEDMNALYNDFVQQWIDYRASRHAKVEAFLFKMEDHPNGHLIIAELMSK